jgi:plastocyanin
MKKRIGLLVVLALVVTGVVSAVASARSGAAAANTITVTMTDFHFKLTKPATIKHGVKYTVTEINKGNAIHNIDFQGVKAGKLIQPGKKATFTVVFKKKGKLQYICDVPRHAELGMAGFLAVK